MNPLHSPRMQEFATIVLAAGSSSRLPFHKAFLQLGQTIAIKRVIETTLKSRSTRSLVVLGSRADSLIAEIKDFPVETIINRNYASGRTGSLKCALRHLSDKLESTAVLIFPVDCPFVSHQVLDSLIDCLLLRPASSTESVWIVPSFEGRRGHPILLSGPVLKRILWLDDDFSLRDFLYNLITSEQSLVQIELPVDSQAVVDNINTSADVQRLLKREGFKCSRLPL
ncbi:MAG: nucleotidyltransferase family protein [Candidatus Melainabacteria bacterium]|nr:nucleotidyltransferase family protein [Candidatus Melainabacteria bacterium]